MEAGRRRTNGMLPLLALHAVSEYCRLDRKPPVTAGLLAVNTLIYLRPAFLDRILPTLHEVLFNPRLILQVDGIEARYASCWILCMHRDLKRFFLSAFYHIDESHLVYNMMSLLWKGIQLETSMGSVKFASMVAVLLGMSQGITLVLAKSLLFFDYRRAYYQEYAAGFSGVLFAMRVVLNSQSDNYTYIHGLMIPSRYAAWAELILIQMFVPGVSFLGHLGGILAGILYLWLKASYSGPDPLTRIIRGFTNVLNCPVRLVRKLCGFLRRQISGRGTVGGRQMNTTAIWRCQTCTFDNSGWLSMCEMCGTSRDGGLSSFGSSNQSHDLPLEELRLRRVERFSR